VANYVTQMQL